MTATVNPMTGTPYRAPSDPDAVHEIFWRETEPVVPGPPLRTDLECDVAIVGAGYTGMWTAFFLKQADPSLRIHVMEADYAGAGASGHNDGFATPTIGHSLSALVHRFGTERAKLAYSVVGRSMLELRRFCTKYDVDAELEPTGYFQVAASRGQVRLLERDIDLIGQLGGQGSVELLGARAAREHIGSPAIVGAFKVGGSLINPHKLSRGLLRVVRELGVQVHESTAVTALRKVAGGHELTTPYARVRAPQVLLATNAYQHRFAGFERKVAPVWSYAAVTRPLTDRELAAVHWPEREGFVEAGNFIVFGRLTRDGRLLFGGGRATYHRGRDMDESRHIHSPAATRALRAVLSRYFPQWSHVPFSHTYGGCVAITREMVPHVGSRGNGVHYAYGFCGNGISVTHAAAKSLRDLILGRDSTFTRLLYVHGAEKSFPPEPVTFVGSRVVTAALAAQDRYPNLVRAQIF